jgi:hypothetical protein
MRDIKSKMIVAGRVGASGGRPTNAGQEHPHGGTPAPAPRQPVERAGRPRRIDDDERVGRAAVCHYMIQPLVERYGGCMMVLKVS